MTVVIDTNVILVANGLHLGVDSECVAECALRLQSVMANGRLALDSDFQILLEYQNKTSPKAGKSPGDAFVKWALQNNSNSSRCDLVDLEEHAERGFVSFPDDEQLRDFDPPDRKFVAVSAAHPDTPPILQAADSKWLNWYPALANHGIGVEFLCPESIQRFHESKFGK